MNLGYFAGGLAQGFSNGTKMGMTIRDVIRQNKLEELRQKGMEEARAAREAAVNGAISDTAPTTQAAPVDDSVKPSTSGDPSVQPASVNTTPNPEPAPVTVQTSTPTAAAGGDTPQAAPSVSTQTPVAQPNSQSVVAKVGLPMGKSDAAPAQAQPDSAAQPAQKSDVTAAVAQPSTAQAGSAQPDASSKFWVGGKGYATRDEAYKAAEASAPQTLDFYMKNAVPKLQEAYIEQGDPEKADALGQWAQKRQNQNYMMEWSKAETAMRFGDVEKAADHIFNMYKQFNDGVTPVSKETVKDKDGNITGFNVRLKDDGSGEVKTQFIDRKTMLNMGLGGLAPTEKFALEYKQQADADKAAMDARIKAQQDQNKLKTDLTLQGYKDDRADVRANQAHQQKLSEIALTKQLDAANLGQKERATAEAKVGLLRDAGYSDDQIGQMMPAIVGAGEYKKITDPSERRALITSDLLKNDPTFGHMSPQDQGKKIDQMMGVIYGAGGPAQKVAQPAKTAAPPVYVRDTQTGQIFIKQNGGLVPVQQGPSAGLPGR